MARQTSIPEPSRQIGLAVVAAIVLCAPSRSGAETRATDGVELQVVGVFRTVDLTGRSIRAPREIYLRADATPGVELAQWVGSELEVFRRVDLPGVKATPAPRAEPAAAKAGKPSSTPPAATAPQPQPSQSSPSSSPSSPSSSQPSPVSPQPPPPAQIDVLVGRVEMVAVRGDMAIARVVTDSLTRAGKPTEPSLTVGGPLHLPAIMTGDFARPEPKPPEPVRPSPLTEEERLAIERQQRSLQRERPRRKRKRGPYERKVMRWKL